MLKTLIKIATSGTVGKIIKPIMDALTPEIRKYVVKMYIKLKEKTDATPNEADDCITELIKDMIGITDREIAVYEREGGEGD